jgi:hypothetical protein
LLIVIAKFIDLFGKVFAVQFIKEKPMYKYLFSLVIVLYFTNTFSQTIYTTDYESQADVTVYVVDYESQCDLKVHKVDYESQAGNNDGTWFFVEYESQADKKIYFVNYESQADLKIYFVDYESQAGWRKNAKKYLMY